MTAPITKRNQLPRRKFDGIPADVNTHIQLLTDSVNSLLGHGGPIVLANHIDLQGYQVKNVGSPTDPGDVVQQAFAESNYSASAIRPQLEGNGSSPLQTVRQINSVYQRETTSSWLNSLFSTPPNANTANVSFGGGGGTTTITINPTVVGFADGSKIFYPGKTDTVTNPTSIAIATINSAGNTATVVTAVPYGSAVSPGAVVYITGNSQSAFNTTAGWIVSGITPPDTFTFQESVGSLSGTGGTLSTGGVYYYVAQLNKTTLTRFGAFSADTPQNRLTVNYDNNQIVAVAVVNSGGGVLAQSGGGGTPTTGAVNAGSFF